jgi:EmrB/QacA subfamily drug resistance transporter
MSATAVEIADLAPPASDDAKRLNPRRWAILAVLLAVELMDVLDGTIVNVAAPSIRAELGASATALQWIVGGYALTYALGLIPAARMGDIRGRRFMFVVGSCGFTVMSLLCALAPTSGLLIAARLLQGAFAAVMVPQALGIIRDIFPNAELPKVFGLYGPVIGMGAMLGPVIGGALIELDAWGTDWRSVFLINLPLGFVAVVGALKLMPESRASDAPTLDVPGAILVALGSGLLIYPLIQGREAGWPAWTFAMLAAGVIVFVAFGFYEHARDRRGVSPLVTTSLFVKRAFTSGVTVVALFFAGMIGVLLCTTLYLQIGAGYSPLHAGLTTAPWSVGTAIGAIVGSAVLVPRIGRTALHIGYTVMFVANVATIAVIEHYGTDITSLELAAPLLVSGIGLGMCIAPMFAFILAGVDEVETGSASGVLNALQQFGSAAGVAALGTVFFSALPTHGFASSLNTVLWIECGVLVVCALLTLLLPREADLEAIG